MRVEIHNKLGSDILFRSEWSYTEAGERVLILTFDSLRTGGGIVLPPGKTEHKVDG